MSRSQRKPKKRPGAGAPSERVDLGDGGAQAGPVGRSTKGRDFAAWAAQRRLVFRFVGLLALCTLGFNLWFFLGIAKSDFFQWYLRLNAETSALGLRLLGDDVSAIGTTISSNRFSVDIQRGCEAIQVSAFYIFAVFAWPIPMTRSRRATGLIVGSVLLLMLNLVRIMSLYYTGIYFPGAFEIMHIDVWQPAFIVLAVLIWVCWLGWASRTPAVKADAVT